MTKAELEQHRSDYETLMRRAKQAIAEKLHRHGLELAVLALRHVDGMMQHASKYDSLNFTNIDAIEYILKYAPLLLDAESLDSLQSTLRDQRRIKRNISVDIEQLRDDAHANLLACYRLWDLLESRETVCQEGLSSVLGGDQRKWAGLVASWEEMGLIRRTTRGVSIAVSIVSRFDEEVQAKCMTCGTVTRGAKSLFSFTPHTCDKCRNKDMFVLISG